MAETQNMHITLVSFGHTFGIPKNTDLLYSIRHLPVTNVKNHQRYDGRHTRIQNELLNLPEYEDMVKTIFEEVMKIIHEQKQGLITVAIGCEQGRHRSVAVVERLAEQLTMSYDVEVNHRDLSRNGDEKKKRKERTANRDRKYSNCHEDS